MMRAAVVNSSDRVRKSRTKAVVVRGIDWTKIFTGQTYTLDNNMHWAKMYIGQIYFFK